MVFPAHALTEKEKDKLRMMSEWIPYSSCQETRYLKQCFLWSTEECEGMTEKSSLSCLNQYQSQWSNPMTASLDRWQDKIVDCVQRDIRVKLKGREISSVQCKNKGGG